MAQIKDVKTSCAECTNAKHFLIAKLKEASISDKQQKKSTTYRARGYAHICATMKMSTSHYQSCSLQLLTRFLLGRDHTTEKLHLCEVKTGLPLMRWSCHVNFEVSVRPPALHLEMSESIIVCDCGIVGVV